MFKTLTVSLTVFLTTSLMVRLGAVTPLPPYGQPGRKIPIVFLYAFPYDQGNNLKCFNSNQSDADKQGN